VSLNERMRKSVATPSATAVSLFRGYYARVARDSGVDVSYVSRIARGQRESEAIEKALNREFSKILSAIQKSSAKARKALRQSNEKDNQMKI